MEDTLTVTTNQVGTRTYTTKNRVRMVRLIGKCKVCKRGHVGTMQVASEVVRVSDEPYLIRQRTWNISARPEVVCCGRQVMLHDIKGTKSDHKCDAKCLNSKGHICECSCGGANHGKGWEG